MTKTFAIAAAGFLMIASSNAQAGDTIRYLDGTALSPLEFIIHANPAQFPDRARANSALRNQTTAPVQSTANLPVAGALTQHWMRRVDPNAGGGSR